MLKRKKFWKRIGYVFIVLILLLVILGIYLVQVSKVPDPKPKDTRSLQLQRSEPGPGFYTLGNNWFRKSKSGLYELYVEGDAFERGMINGKLTKELVVRQEEHFTDQ